MRLLIAGASGRTGQKVVEQALERGHHVTAILRRPIIRETERLRVVIADPCHAEELVPALAGQDAVISCLGQRRGGSPWLVRDAAAAMVKAMEKAGPMRYLIVSGALLYPTRNPLVLLLRRAMAEKLSDARAAEIAISKSNANWTIVRPPHLREEPGKGYRLEAGTCPSLTWGLPFRDLANCLLDLSEGEAFSRQVVGVASC